MGSDEHGPLFTVKFQFFSFFLLFLEMREIEIFMIVRNQPWDLLAVKDVKMSPAGGDFIENSDERISSVDRISNEGK